MNPDNLIKFGLMKKLSTGEYVLTIKGQRLYSAKPFWKPDAVRDRGFTKGELDKWLGGKLIWESESDRKSN